MSEQRYACQTFMQRFDSVTFPELPRTMLPQYAARSRAAERRESKSFSSFMLMGFLETESPYCLISSELMNCARIAAPSGDTATGFPEMDDFFCAMGSRYSRR